MKIGILCNGPGELWGWARPVVRELGSRGHEVVLWLLRCPYASGKEAEAARSFGSGCRVVPPMGIFSTLRAFSREKNDAVIQLGGDIFWGKMLAKKSSPKQGAAPLFCYTYGKKNGLGRCNIIFTAYPKMAEQIGHRAVVIGDLVKDAMELDEGESVWDKNYRKKKIIFLPGSRPEIRHKSLTLVRDIVAELKKFDGFENFEPAVLFPPFASDAEFTEWQSAHLSPTRTGAGVAMREADYVVTQPGTNTLEIMHAGANGLAIAPLSFLKEIPISGIGGLIANIPFVGPKIKEFVLRKKLKKLKGYVSLPNRIADAPLLSELAGYISPAEIAEKIAFALNDAQRLSYTRNYFLEISRSAGGATKKLCDAVEGNR